jgi:carbon storage regulator
MIAPENRRNSPLAYYQMLDSEVRLRRVNGSKVTSAGVDGPPKRGFGRGWYGAALARNLGPIQGTARENIEGMAMLVLSRKKNESIVINNDITIVVVEIRGDKVRLGVEAPKEVPVHRREVYDAIRRNQLPVSDPAEAEGNGAMGETSQ